MKRALACLVVAGLLLAAPSTALGAKGGKKAQAALAAATFVSVDTPVVHVGDALVVSASGDGVVTCYGSTEGVIVWAYPFVGYHTSYVLNVVGYSQAWAANPVPLDGRCVLYQQDALTGVPVEVASSGFSLLP